VLPGETVVWSNVSERRHTVTADGGAFDSGDLLSGDSFSAELDAVGPYAYHCTVHPGMVGEVDVRRVILGTLPTAAIPTGDHVAVTGRTADPSRPVHVERSVNGTDFTPVANATPAADGSWSATITAVSTADYRASSDADVSQTRRLLVNSRKVSIRATRSGVHVAVTPSLPYGRILLESDLRERFGWWPIAHARLDYVSEADLRVRGPARVRVILVDRDGWTPLASSPVVVLRRAAAP